MWIMTCETRESSVAIAEACGAVQKPWLVAHIPDVRPIGIVVEIACLTMACAAQRADLNRSEPARILNRFPACGFGMRSSRAVAGLAVNAGFARLNLKIFRQLYRACRVTPKTAQSGLHRVESAIDQI
jgi:hypothetical protein